MRSVDFFIELVLLIGECEMWMMMDDDGVDDETWAMESWRVRVERREACVLE